MSTAPTEGWELTFIAGERLVHVIYADDGSIEETRPVYLVIGDPE